ncbi:calcium-transporting ATPase type 2C member 1-like [Penaeus monodon]|uniref:calcium-transporting ATPase type 2C member 1-like n=1 Tax=Penaeus monodon TaxID=6687 RepID=UPI0018A7397D|nr:calcium-transporting ATPase type 2C member 1-like [Penaeus monodon]
MVVPVTCMCLRDGNVNEYQAKELVPGDIVHLNIGDRVPADLRLFEANDLSIDESSFTGETEPADKNNNLVTTSTYGTSGSLANIAYMGTFVRTGRGKGIVISTGEKSQFDLQYCCKFSCSSNTRGLAHSCDNDTLSRNSSYGPALGFSKRLHTVETLGCVTTVCSDKNWNFNKEGDECHVTGVGYSSDGSIVFEGGYSDLANEAVTKLFGNRIAQEHQCNISKTSIPQESKMKQATLSLFLEGIVLKIKGVIDCPHPPTAFIIPHRPLSLSSFRSAVCNNAEIVGDQLLGQPTEGAILLLLLNMVCTMPEISTKDWKKCLSVLKPRKCQSKSGIKKTGEVEWLVKGSVEHVLASCTQYNQSMATLPLSQEKCQQIMSACIDRGRQGLRGARSSVTTLQSTGVSVKMVTGDAQEDCLCYCPGSWSRVGPGTVYSGDQVDSMDERVLLGIIQDATVFYRVSPRHKLRIVKNIVYFIPHFRALQDRGEIVSMTGDGVNDVVA